MFAVGNGARRPVNSRLAAVAAVIAGLLVSPRPYVRSRGFTTIARKFWSLLVSPFGGGCQVPGLSMGSRAHAASARQTTQTQTTKTGISRMIFISA